MRLHLSAAQQGERQGSLIDYESHKIKRIVLPTVAELFAFMKDYGSARFYCGLWMVTTAVPVELHLCTDTNETIRMIQVLR